MIVPSNFCRYRGLDSKRRPSGRPFPSAESPGQTALLLTLLFFIADIR